MTGGWTDLYWLPLGAGGHFVRWNGRMYEALAARRQHRPASPLYHCAMQIRLGGATYAVEMGPVWNVSRPDRAVVRHGPVGAPWLGRFRMFRYEVRCWPGGFIPDVAEAVDSPVRMSDDPAQVAEVLQILPQVPPLTWGRDELGTGDMWNSNSLVSWALASTGHDLDRVRPPLQGRAPGWHAGLVLARRQARRARSTTTGRLEAGSGGLALASPIRREERPMRDSDDVTCIHAADRRVADPTPGKVREQAIDVPGLWSGLVRSDPGATSGWHHHGDHDTSVYVVSGTVRIEFGPGGAQAVNAGPGDFLHIPGHLVHREINPGPAPSQEVVTRSGTGPLTVNVDG